MRRRPFLFTLGAMAATSANAQADLIKPDFKVSLRDAHKGTLEIDTQLLDSYGKPPENLRQFYFEARRVFEGNVNVDFTHDSIVESAAKHGVMLMGGPMLGNLKEDGVSVWMRPATAKPIEVRVEGKVFVQRDLVPGEVTRIRVDGLSANKKYQYEVVCDGSTIADGQFVTAPRADAQDPFRLTFGSCCHKIGVHNPNLFRQVIDRQPHAMLLLGDIAVDDRNDQVSMHRCDYQLRDVSQPWSQFVSNVPCFAAWDDHDYFDNDLSGIPKRFSETDRDAVRGVWTQNWNNPPTPKEREGIYFSTRMGPVEVIMLDTRSCRENQRRNKYGAYLGGPQMEWLKQTLKASTAPFKVISSGTMWSDYVSKAKDSWGSWDRKGREEVFDLIEQNNIGGVLLVSGDRHGARGFKIPRPSGFSFYEFEPATLGGVSGPAGIVKNCSEQLFGYSGQTDQGENFVAFGEFTFESDSNGRSVTFRLITQHGDIVEEIRIPLDEITPRNG